MRDTLLLVSMAAAGLSACGGRPSATLTTVVDSTADTVFVRISGDVPPPAVRHAVEELRIAPGIGNDTLFTDAYEFSVDRLGQMWVFDQSSRSIFLFAPDGRFLRRVGRDGGGPGEFRANSGMAATADGMAVLDFSNGRLSFFSDGGDLLSSWPVNSGFHSNDALVVDRSGTIRLAQPVVRNADGGFKVGLVRIDSAGRFSDSTMPPDLKVPEVAYVAVANGARAAYGSSLHPTAYWAWHPDGYYVAANGGTYEIVLARPNAKPLAIRRWTTPVPVSDEERADEQARITYGLRRTVPSWTWTGPSIPPERAPLAGLAVTRDGKIWATVPLPSERIPDADLESPRDAQQPVFHYRRYSAYEVFDPDGRFVGRVELPKEARLMEADGDTVWAIAQDPNGLPAVVRLRIDPPFSR